MDESLDEKLERYQQELQRSESELNKAVGRLESILEEILELGYSDIKEARSALEQLEIKIGKKEKRLEKALREFEIKYKEATSCSEEEEEEDED